MTAEPAGRLTVKLVVFTSTEPSAYTLTWNVVVESNWL